RKDALAIMELHMEILNDLRKDLDVDSVVCVGFIMDNTSANLSAMRMLQRIVPCFICEHVMHNLMLPSVEAIVAETRTDEDGKTTTACISVRRGLWTFQGAGYFPHLCQAAVRLLSMHVTTAAAERNWSSWGNTYNAGRSQLNVATAEKMVYIRPTSPRLSQHIVDPTVACSHWAARQLSQLKGAAHHGDMRLEAASVPLEPTTQIVLDMARLHAATSHRHLHAAQTTGTVTPCSNSLTPPQRQLPDPVSLKATALQTVLKSQKLRALAESVLAHKQAFHLAASEDLTSLLPATLLVLTTCQPAP
ncbi:hypothetical protein QJQ45_021706, partial [Haematococcus lacustris]